MNRVCIVLGVIFAVMLAATLYMQHVTGSMGMASVDSLLSPLKTSLLHYDGIRGAAKEEEKSINLLLIGQDKREGEKGNRSDSMILCTFQPGTRKLYMTSFLRDLYVPIPGKGSNRINAAYAFGGAPLLKKTLEENFAVEIDGCVEVDFQQFAQIIDTLGGVTIELRTDEVKVINRETGSNLPAGLQKLNGEQALSYARIRKLDGDGDFSRTARQRKVLESLWENCKSEGLVSFVKTVKAVLPMVKTDMGTGEILGYALRIFPYLSKVEIISQRIPEDGQYTNQKIDGMDVLVPDMDSTRKTIQNILSSKNE